MKRTTLMLPAKLKLQAERLARIEGISLAQLVRDALEQRLAASKDRATDPLFADVEVVADDWPSDVAENHDKYLLDMLKKQHFHDRRRTKRAS